MKMPLPAKYGPWALVAGASSGLGYAISSEAARQGLNVVMIARRGDLLAAGASAIAAEHHVEVRPVVANLASEDIAQIVADATDDLDLGAFIYNAAAEPVGPFAGISPRKHVTSLTVNCVTPTVLTHQLGTRMLERGRGCVVLVTSTGSLFGTRLCSSYSAAKAYQLNLAEGLWDEWRDRGVDVLAYAVGSTATPNYFSRQASEHEQEIEVDDPLQTILNRAMHPMSPARVATRLFEVIGQGPTQFSNPIDERLAARLAALPRAEAVGIHGEMMSRMMAFEVSVHAGEPPAGIESGTV
jgi:short-subunit dehydrogenase